MMKKILIILLLASGISGWAETMVAQDGTVYRNVTIVSADPERMLIVHDGGGCQVYFKDLKPDSLSPEQRKTVEQELLSYEIRRKRIERLRIEKEAFELAQREKGLIEFEDSWMTPAEREKILGEREKQRLEMERLRIQIAKEQAELEKEQMQNEQARRLLEEDSHRGSYFTYSYSSPYWRGCSSRCSGKHHHSSCRSRKSYSSSRSGSSSSIQPSSGFNQGPFNRYGAEDFNQGPFNRYGAQDFNQGPFNR